MRYFYSLLLQTDLTARDWSDFPHEKKKNLKYKTNAISITFGLRYIHGQSLKEIDFPTRNAVDRFFGRLSFNNHDSA